MFLLLKRASCENNCFKRIREEKMSKKGNGGGKNKIDN